jgi:hypothetical protein
MPKAQYQVFEALNSFFGVILTALRGLITFPAGLRRYEDAPI